MIALRARMAASSILLFTVAPAVAATLPIIGSYGDAEGCKVTHTPPPGSLLVEQNGITGYEFGCSFRSVKGPDVLADCQGPDGPVEHWSLTIVENRAAGTLTYAKQDNTVTLHRCR